MEALSIGRPRQRAMSYAVSAAAIVFFLLAVALAA